MNFERRILLKLAHILKDFVFNARGSVILELQVLWVRTLLIQRKLRRNVFFLLLVVDEFLNKIFVEL